MFTLNLKIAFRNLWKNFRYTSINVLGLAAGLAGALLILVYVNFETGYDKWDPSLKQVYRVGLYQTVNGAEKKAPEIEGHFVKMIREKFPEVSAVTRGYWENIASNTDYSYNQQNLQPAFKFARVDTAFFANYPIKAIYGNMEDIFRYPNAIAISLTKAREIFGAAHPINKTIIRKGGANFPDQPLVVKAVFDEERQRSYFGINHLESLNFKEYGDEEFDVSYNVLLKFREDADVQGLISRINESYVQEMAKRAMNNSSAISKISTPEAYKILKKEAGVTSLGVVIEPVPDLNLTSFFSPDPKQKTIYILSALAIFLMVISCVNFTNLAIAQATSRAKEVGIKKVMGAYRFDLTKQFLAETALQCFFAFFIALIVTELALPSVNSFFGIDIKLFANPDFFSLLLQGIGILAGIIILSGLYPALFLSGFLPARVLKGNFSTGAGAVTLRKSLMAVQFTIAGGLIICFLVMKSQLTFMKESSLGMQPNQLMSLAVQAYNNRSLNHEQFSQLKQRLKGIEGVEDVSRSTSGALGGDGWKLELNYKGTTTELNALYNDLDYFKTLNAEIIDGRDFSEKTLGTDTVQNIVLNETAVRVLGLTKGVGEVLDVKAEYTNYRYTVIGIVKDIKNTGFDKAVQPTAFLMSDFKFHWRKVVLLRLNSPNIAKTIDLVKKQWKEIEPKTDPVYSFADEKFAKMNAGHERMAKIMFWFSFVTLVVSAMGLFALAAYNSKVRIKEIAVRKILGASTLSILKLLNTDLVKVVIIANLLADVLAFIYMQNWFKTFVYRIDMPVMPFVAVNIGTILLTLATVSIQSLKAAKASPVTALKYE